MRQRLQEAISRKRKTTPMKSYSWHIELPFLNGFEGDHFDISTRILSVNLPYNNFSTDKEMHQNSYWYYANGVDIGDITIEVMEFEDCKTFEYFEYWQNMISNSNGTFNPPKFYKKDVNFYRLDGLKRQIINDKYQGYFVSGISEVSNDYDTNDVVRYTITLTGDSVTHTNLGRKKPGGESVIDTKLSSGDSLENIFIEVINKSKNTMNSVYDLLS